MPSGIWIDGAVVVALGGVLIRGGVDLARAIQTKGRLGAKKNGDDNIKQLLFDIKGIGSTTLTKVLKIEAEQVSLGLAIKEVTTEITNIKSECNRLEREIKEVDTRFFKHVSDKKGG